MQMRVSLNLNLIFVFFFVFFFLFVFCSSFNDRSCGTWIYSGGVSAIWQVTRVSVNRASSVPSRSVHCHYYFNDYFHYYYDRCLLHSEWVWPLLPTTAMAIRWLPTAPLPQLLPPDIKKKKTPCYQQYY